MYIHTHTFGWARALDLWNKAWSWTNQGHVTCQRLVCAWLRKVLSSFYTNLRCENQRMYVCMCEGMHARCMNRRIYSRMTNFSAWILAYLPAQSSHRHTHTVTVFELENCYQTVFQSNLSLSRRLGSLNIAMILVSERKQLQTFGHWHNHLLPSLSVCLSLSLPLSLSHKHRSYKHHHDFSLRASDIRH